MSSKDQQAGERTGILEGVRTFVENIGAHITLRLRLAGLEGREAGKHLIKLLVLVVAMVVLLALGWVLLCLAIAFLIAGFCDDPHVWVWIVGGMAVFHLLGVAGIAFILKDKIATPLFPQTLDEFKKDQEWLEKNKRTDRN